MTRPPVPQPLPSPVVDGHTHLDHARGGEDALDVADALAIAASVGVTRMVQIGCDLDAARWTADAVERYPHLLGGVALHPTEASEIVYGTVDVAPNPADDVERQAVSPPDVVDPVSGNGLAEPDWQRFDRAFAEIEKIAGQPRIRVVGETGLDHYWVKDSAGRQAQEVSFRRHIDLAKRLGKALQIHDRDAHRDVLRVLHDEGAPDRTVFHCFSGDPEMARHCAEQGWYLSFAGTLTFKNAEPLRQALRVVPLEQVLVETDAPYLAPVPHRGRTNAGYLVPLTVRCMAEVLDLELERVCRVLDETAVRLYGPW